MEQKSVQTLSTESTKPPVWAGESSYNSSITSTRMTSVPSVVSKCAGLDSIEGIADALGVSIESVFAFAEQADPFALDKEGEEEQKFIDEEQAKIDTMKLQNAAILEKMSNLMMNMSRLAKEEPLERKRPEEPVKVHKVKREDYGLNIIQMKSWQDTYRQSLMNEESHRQEIAVARVRGFLDAIRMLTRLQSWWRMMTFKIQFRNFRNGRLTIKRKFYTGWKQHWRAEHLYLYHILGKPFEAWAAEVQDSKRLKEIVKSFYVLCVRRLRLTPQAVMAYFAPPGEYSAAMTEVDQMKIRRLILSKLFVGWRSEMRELRGMRFKASQILARTMRRSKGPMWVKEGVLVTFHIWRRYTAVRFAYRRDEPDPQFKNPHLPQWSKLLSTITLNRIHRKRAQEKGEKLSLTRTFRTWCVIMTMDKSKLVTPLQIAINHWNSKVWTKVFGGWSQLIRERGVIMRLRDKTFFAWKKWSPRKKRLRILKRNTIAWLSLRQKGTVFSEMTGQCFDVIGRRAAVLRILRENVNDRKVMVCALALMGFNSHVIMLDCWRRWTAWWKNRRRWKSSLWHYRAIWFSSRQQAVFQAWKDFVHIGRPGTSLRPTTSVSKSPDIHASAKLFSDLVNVNSASDKRPGTVIIVPPKKQFDSEYVVPQPPIVPNIMLLASNNFISGQKDEQMGALMDQDTFVLFCRCICISAARRRRNQQLLLAPFLEAEEKARLEALAKANRKSSKDSDDEDEDSENDAESLAEESIEVLDEDEIAFREYKKKQEAKKDMSMTTSSFIGDVVKLRQMRDEDDLKSDTQVSEDEDDDSIPVTETSVEDDASVTAGMSYDKKKEFEQAKAKLFVQRKLQRGLDMLDIRLVALAIEEGAEINSDHIHQACKFFGDSNMPFFAMLLAVGTQYIAERIVLTDKNKEVLGCSNPMNAVLLSSHIDRWKRHEITTREMSELTQDQVLADVIGSNYQSAILFRVIVMMTIQKAEINLRSSCILLPEQRSMDDEVKEAMKRKKVERLMHIRKSLSSILIPSELPHTAFTHQPWSPLGPQSIGENLNEGMVGQLCDDEMVGGISGWDDVEGAELLPSMSSNLMSELHFETKTLQISVSDATDQPFGEYIAVPPIVGTRQNQFQLDTEWTKDHDIYSLLHEFTLMTNKLSTEARALRIPLISRDMKLLESAFMAQSRRNYLNLRKMVMTKEQITAQSEKEERLAKKAKDKAIKYAKKIEIKLRKELIDENAREEREREQVARHAEMLASSSLEKGEDSVAAELTTSLEASSSASTKKSKKGKQDKKSKKKGGKKKSGKKSKKGKKSRGSAEDNVEMDIEPADEDAELLQVYDPLDFHNGYVETIMRDPEELVDQIGEADFNLRCSSLGQCLIETRSQRIKHENKDHIILSAARRCKQACNIPRRVLFFMRSEGIEDCSPIILRDNNNSIASWIIKSAVANPAYLDSAVWSLLPPEWWDIHFLQLRIKQELAMVTVAKDNITKKMEVDEDLKEEIFENRTDLQDFLKGLRKNILLIGDKRREKANADVSEQAASKNKVHRAERKIKEAHTAVRECKDIIHKAESMLIGNNLAGAFNLLEVELSHEELEAATADPDVAGKKLRVRAFRLIEMKEAEVPMLEENIVELVEKKRQAQLNVKMFERLCARGNTWLKDMAEAEFNVMIDTQNLVMRMAREEKTIQHTSCSDLRTLSTLRRHGSEIISMDRHLIKEEARIRREKEEFEEAERNRPKTRQDFKSVGGMGRDSSNSPNRRAKRQTSSRQNNRHPGTESPIPGSPGFDGLCHEDYEPLHTPTIQGQVSSAPIVPRELSNDERKAVLAAMSTEEIQATILDSATLDPNSIGSTHSLKQQLKDEAEAELLAKEMEGLEFAEQEAIMIGQALRSQIFDDYWELIIPQRFEVVAKGKEKSFVEEMPEIALEMDEPLGKTTRMWLEIGDQHMDGRKTFWQENDAGEDPLANTHYVPTKARPCDADVGDDAWQAAEASKMSVSIKTEKLAESKHAAAKKGKVAPAPVLESETKEAEKPLAMLRSAEIDMRTEEEKAAESAPVSSKKGGKMFKQAEDPFVKVGKVEINRMRASITHRIENAFDDGSDNDEMMSVVSINSRQHDEYAAATRKGQEQAILEIPDENVLHADLNDDISVGGSINSQQQHDDQASQYLAIMEGEGALKLQPPAPTITDTLSPSNTSPDTANLPVLTHPVISTLSNIETDSIGSNDESSVQNYVKSSILHGSLVDSAEKESVDAEQSGSMQKLSQATNDESPSASPNASPEDIHKSSILSKTITDSKVDDDDDDNVSVLSFDEDKEKAEVEVKIESTRKITSFLDKVEVPLSPPAKQALKSTLLHHASGYLRVDENDERNGDEELNGDDEASQGSKLKPVSFVRISQQLPASEAAAAVATETDRSRGVIEIKRNAPEHNAHREYLQSGGGYLEMQTVTEYVLTEERQPSSQQLRVNSPVQKVKLAQNASDNAFAVLAGGQWSLVAPPGTGTLPKNTDFKDSSQFQGLSLTGTALESHSPVRTGNLFVIDGLVDHELADVFSSLSKRLAPSLGFSDNHPSLIEHGVSQITYGSLLEMVESELSMPLSSSSKHRITKNTRGLLASSIPATRPKKKKKKKKKKEAENFQTGSLEAFSSTHPGFVEHKDADHNDSWNENGDRSVSFANEIPLANSSSYGDEAPLMIDTRRQRLSNLTLQMFEDNVREALKSAEDVAIERIAALTPEGRGGSARPLLTWSRATLHEVLNHTSKRRREQRAFVRAGLTLLEEDQRLRDRAPGESMSKSFDVKGTQQRVHKKIALSSVNMAATESLDFDSAFNFMQSNQIDIQEIKERFAVKSQSDGALLKNKIELPIAPIINGYEMYDEDIAERRAHSQFHDGVKAYSYPKVGSAGFRRSSEHPSEPVLSPSRTTRLVQLQQVYADMMQDDDDALEQAYAAVLGLAGVQLTLPDDIDDEENDEDDWNEMNEQEMQGNASEITPVSFNVVATRSKAGSRGNTPINSNNYFEENKVGKLVIEVPVPALHNLYDTEVALLHQKSPLEGRSWIEDPRSRPVTTAAMSTPQARSLPTPILSLQEFVVRRPDQHFFGQSPIAPSAQFNVKAPLVSDKLDLSGKNAWVVPKPERTVSASAPLVLQSGSGAAEPHNFLLDIDSNHISQDSGILLVRSHGLLSLQSHQNSTSMTDNLKGASHIEPQLLTDTIPQDEDSMNDSISVLSSRHALRKSKSMSLQVADHMDADDEFALEQELRELLHPSRPTNRDANMFNGKVEYNMAAGGSNMESSILAEMEFVKQARQLAGYGRKKKGPAPRLGGGKMLPPINPIEPNPSDLDSTLFSKRERNPSAPKVDTIMYEMKYPRRQRKNKFLAADVDFPISLTKSLNGPLREPLKRKGYTRSMSDLRHSIDEQMLSMQHVNDVESARNKAVKLPSTDSESYMRPSQSDLLSIHSGASTHSSRPPAIRVPTGDSVTGASGVAEDVLALNSGRRLSK